MMKQTMMVISVDGAEIKFFTEADTDYISLTDLSRRFNVRTEVMIQNWLRNRNTIEFLGLWEQFHNPSFNHIEFDVIKTQTGLNSFSMSATQWIGATNAIGIISKAGRYGGTFAHRDIALEFGSWLSPSFKLLVIKELQRLKAVESVTEKLEWDVRRMLSKVNYMFHTDAVKTHLIPPAVRQSQQVGMVYASEADLLNLALFGVTAKQWKALNPEDKRNLRDAATTEQLVVLSNLENLNAEFIKQGLSHDERLYRLNEVAIYQMNLLFVHLVKYLK